MALNENEKVLYTSSRETDEIYILDLRGNPIDLVSVDATPGVLDKPDTLFSRGRLLIALRATGKLTIINNPGTTRPIFVDVATPLDVNRGYAVHGLAVRPCSHHSERDLLRARYRGLHREKGPERGAAS